MIVDFEECRVCELKRARSPHVFCIGCCAHERGNDMVLDETVYCGGCGCYLHAKSKPRTLEERESDDAQTAWEKERGI